MPDLRLRLHKDLLIVAPLLTADLVDPGMEHPESLEFLTILDEDLIKETYRRFKMAGAQCAPTNTLRAHRSALEQQGLEFALKDINQTAVRLVRELGFEHIFGVLELSPLEVFCEQAECLLAEAPDALMLVEPEEQGAPRGVSHEGAHPHTSVPAHESAHPHISVPAHESAEEHISFIDAIEALRELSEIPVIAPVGADIDYVMDEDFADSLTWLQHKTQEEDVSLDENTGALSQSRDDNRGALSQSRDDNTGALSQSDASLMVCPRVALPSKRFEAQQRQAVNEAADALADFALLAHKAGVGLIGTAPGSSPIFTGALFATVSGLDVR